MSARTDMLDLLRELLTEVNGGRYFVKRGVINWITHEFPTKPFAVAIMMDDTTLMRNPFNRANMTLEMATAIPQGDNPMIDDGIYDEMLADAEVVIRTLQSKMKNGDNIVTFVDTQNMRALEFHDLGISVQGIIVSFTLDY